MKFSILQYLKNTLSKTRSAGTSAVIGIAIGILTQTYGLGATLFGATGEVMVPVANAAFSTTATHLTINTINNEGNIFKSIESLGSEGFLKNLGVNVVSAGINAELLKDFEINTNSKAFSDIFQKNLVTSATRTTISYAVNGGKPSDVLNDFAKNLGINTVAEYTAGQIGNLYYDKDVNYVEHKLLHGTLGAATGYALGGKQGAVAGAIAGVTSEVIAEWRLDDVVEKSKENIFLESQNKERELTKEEKQIIINETTRSTENLARLVNAGTLFALGFDAENITIGDTVSTNAIENNYLQLVSQLAMPLLAATGGYLLYDINKKASKAKKSDQDIDFQELDFSDLPEEFKEPYTESFPDETEKWSKPTVESFPIWKPTKPIIEGFPIGEEAKPLIEWIPIEDFSIPTESYPDMRNILSKFTIFLSDSGEKSGKKSILVNNDVGKETSKIINKISNSDKKLRGARNPVVREAIKKGQEEHKKFKEKLKNKKGWDHKPFKRDPLTGKMVKPDGLTPTERPIEYKPNTISGRKKGVKQLKIYERVFQKKGKVLYYDPK